ncbi:MAG: SDR family NAD(P)-dependent oxidoreductase [Thermodesulfobacteriota bacterium]
MKIIVTGCAGFIGSRITELLISSGSTVFGLDNFSDSYDIRLKHFRLNKLNLLNNFKFFECDISDTQKLSDTYQKIVRGFDSKIDSVINLAARAGVRYSIENPGIYYSTNVFGTLNLLELCKTKGINKFVLASTSSIYGNNETPFIEDQITDKQLSPYASSKKAAEGLCYTYYKNFNLDISILRYFTVYGPAGRPDMSVYRFIKWISEGEDVVFYGDGNQKRDFTYVDDIAYGTILALKNLGFEIINLGSGNPVSLNDIVNMINVNIKKDYKIVHYNSNPADIDSTWADISKAKKILDWRPECGLLEGIKNSIEWYRNNYKLVKNIEV